jgi:predicted PurR-regulated permease PerM
MELNKKNMRKIMILITFTVLLFVGLLNLKAVMNTVNWVVGILMPFIIGGCIAFILSVPMRLFEEKLFRKGKSTSKILEKIRRPLSLLLSILMVIGIIFIVIFLIAPELGNTVSKLIDTIPLFFDNAEKWFTNLTEKYPEIQKYVDDYQFDWQMISTKALEIVNTFGTDMLSSTVSILGSIVSTVTDFVIGFVFAIYLLSKKEKLAQQGKKILYSYLPMKRADRIVVILKLTHKSFSNFISGQCVEAVIEGCMFFLILSIIKFDYALLIGVLVGFTALIPIFGALIGCVIGTLLLFMVSPVQALWFIVIFLVLQQVDSNLVYPYVVGGSIGLPSIWVLFAVTVGGSLMGVAGMLIFIPLFSVFYVLMRENVMVRLMLRRVPEEKYKEPCQITMEQQRTELEERGYNRERKRRSKDDSIEASELETKQSKAENLKVSSGKSVDQESTKLTVEATSEKRDNIKSSVEGKSEQQDILKKMDVNISQQELQKKTEKLTKTQTFEKISKEEIYSGKKDIK